MTLTICSACGWEIRSEWSKHHQNKTYLCEDCYGDLSYDSLKEKGLA